MPQAPDLSGRALDGRYELRALIGEGAFGRVYEGRDRRLDREIAVKVIKPWWGDDPEWASAFEREARLLASVSDPGIVQIYDAGHAPEGLYYVSELVRGEDLASTLRRGPLHPGGACAIAERLCRALAHAHRRGIVHRDVKPANVMLAQDGRVKLGDLGIARAAAGSTGGEAAVAGTPRYMAPEQGRGLPATPATDVYAAGVVLYEMLTGSPPFTGSSVVELALSHERDPPPPLPASVPGALAEVVSRALSKEPAGRYANGAEMADALAAAAVAAPGTAPAAAPVPAAAAAGAAPTRRAPDPTWLVPEPTRVVPEPTRLVPEPTRRAPAYATAATVSAHAPSPTAPARRHAAGETATEPLRRRGAGRAAHVHRRAAAGHGRSGPVARGEVSGSGARPGRRGGTATALGLVVAVAAALLAGGLALGGAPELTRVPELVHLDRGRAVALARRAHLLLTLAGRYDPAPAGTVIAQRPSPGARVSSGTRVRAVLSRGPAPVPLPTLSGQSVADAERTLRSLGLRPQARQVPAPGTVPGTVTGQSPAGGLAGAGSIVVLSVAETPTWRTVGTFTGGASGPFTIRGARWRIVYRMAFQGTCTWILFCDGPAARVLDAATGRTVAGFGLTEGSAQSQVFDTGPGTYELRVAPGGDAAAWSVTVQDWY